MRTKTTKKRPAVAERFRELTPDGAIEALEAALERLIVAVEQEEDLLFHSLDMMLAYEKARVVLGDPVQDYPGGYEDSHYHLFGWKEEDGCCVCDDYRADNMADTAIGTTSAESR